MNTALQRERGWIELWNSGFIDLTSKPPDLFHGVTPTNCGSSGRRGLGGLGVVGEEGRAEPEFEGFRTSNESENLTQILNSMDSEYRVELIIRLTPLCLT